MKSKRSADSSGIRCNKKTKTLTLNSHEKKERWGAGSMREETAGVQPPSVSALLKLHLCSPVGVCLKAWCGRSVLSNPSGEERIKRGGPLLSALTTPHICFKGTNRRGQLNSNPRHEKRKKQPWQNISDIPVKANWAFDCGQTRTRVWACVVKTRRCQAAGFTFFVHSLFLSHFSFCSTEVSPFWLTLSEIRRASWRRPFNFLHGLHSWPSPEQEPGADAEGPRTTGNNIFVNIITGFVFSMASPIGLMSPATGAGTLLETIKREQLCCLQL